METAEEENGDGKISLPIRLKLHALDYTLAVWTDYVKAGTTDDLYYDTKDLQYIACTDPYTAAPRIGIASTEPPPSTCGSTATNGTPKCR